MNTPAIVQLLSAIAVNGFILCYIGFAWTWNLPAESFLKRVVNRLGKPFFWFGLTHSWEMFSPNPMRVNFRLVADVRLENGKTIQWKAPRFDQLGKCQAFLRVRERKLYENLASQRFPFLKPAFAEYVAKRILAQGYCPLNVELKCTGESIPDLETGESPEFETRTIYTRRIS